MGSCHIICYYVLFTFFSWLKATVSAVKSKPGVIIFRLSKYVLNLFLHQSSTENVIVAKFPEWDQVKW